MEALMARLMQTERVFMDTRQQVAAVPKVSTSLVGTRIIGKAPTFTGEHKDRPEWSFQFIAYMGSANPKSIEAMRWAAMEEDKITAASITQPSFEEHNCSVVPDLGTVVPRKCIDNSEEQRSQKWTRNLARIECHVRQQQQRSPTSTDAVLVTTEKS